MEQKELVIGESRYRIGNMSATVGSRLMMRFIKTMQTALADVTEEDVKAAEQQQPEETSEESRAHKAMILMLTNLEEKDFEVVQNHALEVCTRLDVLPNGTEVFLPVMRNGVIAVKELKSDALTILQLTAASLAYNLAPALSKNGLRAILAGE